MQPRDGIAFTPADFLLLALQGLGGGAQRLLVFAHPRCKAIRLSGQIGVNPPDKFAEYIWLPLRRFLLRTK